MNKRWLKAEFDSVVANILSKPLIELAPLLCASAMPGGHLTLSGILAEQARGIIDAYRRWIALTVCGNREGWVLLAGHIDERN